MLVSAVFAGLLGLAALPASAAATVAVAPTSLGFDERAAGTTSDPQAVVVTVGCTVAIPGPACGVNDVFVANPVLSGSNPADFQVENVSCGGAISNNGLFPTPCAFLVRFKPQGLAGGAREAVLNVGTSTTSSPPSPVAVKGSVPPPPPAVPGKKCKKKGKKGAAAAKKKGCKKKKR